MAKNASLDDLKIDRGDGETRSLRPGGIAFVVVVLLLLGGVGWWLLRPKLPDVRVEPVRQVAAGTAAGAVLDASGYVTARRQATVSSKVTGKVVEVLVEEGMSVTAGQVLARLDDAEARRFVALTEAELEASRRAVEETRVRRAEAELGRQRAQSLAEAGVGSTADLDAAKAQVDSLAARQSLEEQQVEVARRTLAVRQQDLENLTIRAPFDGVAITKDAQPGEMISPVSAGGGFTRTGICTLVDMASLEIEVDVNEAYINRVRPGQEVQATLDAYPDWKIPASVITTVPAADRQKATVLVRIRFGQLDPRILPDMGVKVSFLDEAIRQEASSRPVVLAPEAAVRESDGLKVVFVVSGDTLERRAVQVGGRQGKAVEVLAGLSVGERVVVEGPEDLAGGDRVKIIE